MPLRHLSPIELTDLNDVTPEMRHGRVVLPASTAEAMLLPFIDDDALSHLGLAPFGDEVRFHPLPEVADVVFDG